MLAGHPSHRPVVAAHAPTPVIPRALDIEAPGEQLFAGEYRTVGEFEAFDRAFSEDVAGGVADAQGEIAVGESEP